MSFLSKIEAAMQSQSVKAKEPRTSEEIVQSSVQFKEQVLAKYDIKEIFKTILDWSKKLLGGIIATAIFTNAAFGTTLKNPNDVAKQLENSVKGGGYSIQVTDDTHGNEKMGGNDHPFQKVTFKMVKDGKTVGTATYKSLDTDKTGDGGGEDVQNPGVSISTSGPESGQDAKDAHVALLTLKLGLEKKGDLGDPDGTARILKGVLEHKASDYSKRGYEPIVKNLLDKDTHHDKDKHHDSKTKTVEKTKTLDKKTKTVKTVDKTKKVADKPSKTLDNLSKTGKDLGKDLTKTAKNLGDNASKVGKEVSKDAKKAWESGKSFLNKLASK